MTRGQYTVNSLALLALTVGLAVYDIRTLGCLLMACILSAAIGISLGERKALYTITTKGDIND